MSNVPANDSQMAQGNDFVHNDIFGPDDDLQKPGRQFAPTGNKKDMDFIAPSKKRSQMHVSTPRESTEKYNSSFNNSAQSFNSQKDLLKVSAVKETEAALKDSKQTSPRMDSPKVLSQELNNNNQILPKDADHELLEANLVENFSQLNKANKKRGRIEIKTEDSKKPKKSASAAKFTTNQYGTTGSKIDTGLKKKKVKKETANEAIEVN